VTGSNAPVLLAYDGSPSSAAAIAAASRLVKSRHAVVCNVWARESELDAAQRTAAEGVRLAEAAGFSAEPLCIAERDHTWRALLDAAQRVGASMVVTGAQGLSGIRRALLGSVSTGLVHHARLPVLVVPGGTRDEAQHSPLLLCYDASEASARAIGVAGELFSPAEALVLHVWESWVAHAPALAGASGSVMGVAAELDELANDQSSDVSARGAVTATLAGFEAKGISEAAKGPLWRTVLDVADQHGSPAIVVGSRRHGPVSAALGSVSNGVVHHSHRPVFVVPPAAEADTTEEET
jgi:nucleotide-binding universal stress UspA family protein